MNYSQHYRKRRQSIAFFAATAVAGIAVALLPFTFVQAAPDNENGRASAVAQSVLQWRNGTNTSTSSVWDFLPPGIAKRIFEDWRMPGVGNDKTDPVISDIDTDVDDDEVEIMWQTDEKTRGVAYISEESGFDTDDDDVTTLSSWKLGRDHSVSTDDLDDDTTYYVVIKATDRAGNETFSPEFSFSTDDEDQTDEDAPIITNLESDATESDITVTWNTDEDADSVLYLSTTDPVNPDATTTIEVASATLEQNHELTATDLDPDTIYYGVVTSTDDDGNTATSSQFSVTTDEDDSDDETGPSITAVNFDEGTTTMDVSWTTDEPATSAVHTATSSGFSIGDLGVTVVSDGSLTTSHELSVTGLTASTTYYHRLVSEDAQGNETISAEYTTTTN